MKSLSLLIALLILVGCYAGPAKFTIPDEPKFQKTNATVFEEGICFDNKEVKIFVDNIRLLKAYADKLRQMLINIQKDAR